MTSGDYGCMAGHGHAAGLADTSGLSLDLSHVHHLGLIVRDREQALAGLGNLFGGPASRMEAVFPPAQLRGRIDTASLRLAFVWMGNTLLELLEPTDETSLQGEHLKKHGEGLHHLGFIVPSIEKHLTEVRAHDSSAVIADGTIAGNDLKWAYVDLPEAPGIIVELIERSSVAEQFFQGIYDITGGKLPG